MRNLLSALDLGAAADREPADPGFPRVYGQACARGRAHAHGLGRVLRYAATVIIAVLAGTLVLGELGISVAPILATPASPESRWASARRA
jgi:hypothetical protein